MKRVLIILLTASLFPVKFVTAQTAPDTLIVTFYNVENLFDTRDEPGKNDEEFTPTGERHWNSSLLHKKIAAIDKALLAAGNDNYPDLVGLAEVENLWVLQMLAKETDSTKINYRIIHKESPDPRGIDVAILYNPAKLKPLRYTVIPVKTGGPQAIASRDILHFTAIFRDETIHFFVNHWPSRSGGYLETTEKRDYAAETLRHYLDSLLVKEPNAKLLLMGDFNATPREPCFRVTLQVSLETPTDESVRLVNLSKPWVKAGKGTIKSGGTWDIFDQFICTANLLANHQKIHIATKKTIIVEAPFLLENDSRNLGMKPFRTYLGPAYHGGTSDHLPITTCIAMP
jgi:hypothetical protein